MRLVKQVLDLARRVVLAKRCERGRKLLLIEQVRPAERLEQLLNRADREQTLERRIVEHARRHE